MRNIMVVLGGVAAMLAAHARTIAWWHFDEGDAGAVAPASTVACDQAPTTYATVYSLAGSTKTENSGDYLPRYARPFAGLKVYDPVTGESRINRSAMQFTIARGGSSPSSNSGRAYYGGALKFGNGYSLYNALYNKGTLTVECFVCSTGGVYDTFAPIVGALGGTSFAAERYAIYMCGSGTIGLRFTTSSGSATAYYGDGTAKVNDGLWHHVAFTYDGYKIKIYVDYALDKIHGSTDRTYDRNGNIAAYTADAATWIGGYDYYGSSNGGRRFPGYIDEVRVSDTVLTPDEFLRLQPVTSPSDPDEVLRVRFDNAAGAAQCQYAESVSEDFTHQGSLQIVAGLGVSSFDKSIKVGASVYEGVYADDGVADVASFSQAPNAAGKANCIKIPNATDLLGDKNNTNHNYTVECFFKTRGTSVGSAQTIFKLGADTYIAAQAMFNSSDRPLFCYSNNKNWEGANSSQSDLADGEWHHVAFVSDASNRQVRAYLDYELAAAQNNKYVEVAKGYSLFIGSNESSAQFFDGWIDDCRVTKRALRPEEFLTTHAVGSTSPKPLMMARFENDYKLESLEDDALSVVGTGEARTGGAAPVFVKASPGTLIPDGTNGTERLTNDYSVRLNKSRAVFPVSRLYENDSYTVEFWAKFTGIAEGAPDEIFSGGVHAGILRFVQGDSTAFDWYLYRHGSAAKVLGLAVRRADDPSTYSYLEWILPNIVVDGKWHHCSLVFDSSGGTATVQLYYDYQMLGEKSVNARMYSYPGGHRLLVGESSGETLNIQGYFNSLRISRGVLPSEKFLGRTRKGFVVDFR